MRASAAFLVATLAAAVSGLSAQDAPASAFEVASIKPSSPDTRVIGLFTYPGGRITASLYTLRMLVEEAFGVQTFQVAGGPRWTGEDRFDIVAKPAAASPAARANPANPKLPPSPEQRRMLQTLLEERFQLKWHRETKDGPVLELVRAGKELKLQPPKDRDAYPWVGGLDGGGLSGDGIAGMNISMALLATRLSWYLRRPVVDRTGLEGSFDFRYEYAPAEPDSGAIPAIFPSLKGIGLKLEAARGPVETIVIDAAEKPSAN